MKKTLAVSVYPPSSGNGTPTLKNIQNGRARFGPKRVQIGEAKSWEFEFEGKEATWLHLQGFSYIRMLLNKPHKDISAVEVVEQMAIYSNPGATCLDDPAFGRKSGSGDAAYHAGLTTQAHGLVVKNGIWEPTMDAKAMKQYQASIEELRCLEEEFKEAGDLERAEAAAEKCHTIEKELAANTKTNSRGITQLKKVNNDLEKGRNRVRKAVAQAIKDLALCHPALAKHLELHLKVGTKCWYRPPTPIEWA